MGDVAQKVFWMRESLEKDFFTSDKDGYTEFLKIVNSVASIGVGQITSPLDLMDLPDLTKLGGLKEKIGAYVKDYVTKTVPDKLQDGAMESAMDVVLSKVFLAGHGHIPKNKITDEDVKKGWKELGKKSVLFLISIPTGGAPLAGLLLIFPFLQVLATIDMARKHNMYQQLIDSMLLKYQAILERAKLKHQERLEKELAVSQHALDYNDDQHTKQEEKIVFEGVYEGKSISINSLSMATIRDQVEDRLKKKDLNGRLINSLDGKMQIRLNHRLLPPKLTFLEVGKIYAVFKPSFDRQNFATEVGDDDLLKVVVAVLQHKTEVANVNLLVPFRGTLGASKVDDFSYSDLLEEGVIAEKPLHLQPKPSKD